MNKYLVYYWDTPHCSNLEVMKVEAHSAVDAVTQARMDLEKIMTRHNGKWWHPEPIKIRPDVMVQ